MFKYKFNESSNKDLRDAFFDEIYNLGAKDQNLIILTNDMDVFSLRKFKKDFPKQFYNTGVAEQNMINVAAGLASCGKKIYVFGILSFVTFRCYEQIKFNICSRNLDVNIVGVGAGLSFGFDGPTHHGIQDIMAMHLLPEISILNPADGNSTAACAHISYHSKKPNYIRIDKGIISKIYKNNYDFSKGFKIIKSIKKNNIISIGYMTSKACEIIKKLEKENINIGLIDLFNLDAIESLIKNLLKKEIDNVFILEENASEVGVAAIISTSLSKYDNNIKIEKIGLPNLQIFKYGTREWMHEEFGLSIMQIINKIKKCI